MPDIETLGVLTIDKTTGWQLALGDNADKRQRNCQCYRAVQTEGEKPESYTDNRQMLMHTKKSVQAEGSTPDSSTNKRQDADTQVNTMQTILLSQLLSLIQ